VSGRRRGRDRELRFAEYLQEKHGGLAFRMETGCFDIGWLKAECKPILIQSKSTLTPYAHFGPEARRAALEQAARAGAIAWLLWWPKGWGITKAQIIPSTEWPMAKETA
jgi:hypothetical protein